MKRQCVFFISLAFILILSGCSAMFQGKITMSVADGTLNDLFEDTNIPLEITAPKQVFASRGDSPTHIDLSWSPVAGAVSYKVYRASVGADVNGVWQEPDEGLYEFIQKVYGTQIYSDEIIDTDPVYTNKEYKNRYYYMITAQNEEEGDFSKPTYGFLLKAPSGVTTESGKAEDKIRVKWNKVDGAYRYKIYRSSNENGTASEYLAGVGANELKYDNAISISEQGKDFYYYITSVSSSGTESVKSSLAMGFSLQAGAPQPPTIKSVSRGASASSITVDFDCADTADVSFIIYRNSSEDSTLLKIASLKGTQRQFEDTYQNVTAQYFKPGVYYYYFVQTIKDETGNKLKSPFSSATDKKGKVINEGYMLSAPLTIESVSLVSGIQFRWIDAIGSDSEREQYTYKLYYSNMPEGPYAPEGELLPAKRDSDGYLTYMYSAKSNGFFKITTMHAGIESSHSYAVEPAPLSARAVQVSKSVLLELTTQANANGVYPVSISWEAPQQGAAGYHVYRSTSKESGFRKITENPVSGTSYIDANDTARAGSYYYYKILSINSLEQGSNYTDAEYGYGMLTAKQFFREYQKTLNSSQKKLTLMHNSDNMKKLGSETAGGVISGSLAYNAAVQGLGARITMKYTTYADFKSPSGSAYLIFNGDTNTTASMDASGTMDGTVTVSGMYSGSVAYNGIQIKGGNAGGGSYSVVSGSLASEDIAWNFK